jgi:hypothetical protein
MLDEHGGGTEGKRDLETYNSEVKTNKLQCQGHATTVKEKRGRCLVPVARVLLELLDTC